MCLMGGLLAGYKRSIYLINPRFQIKFALFICIVVSITSLIYPITIYQLLNNIITTGAKNNPALVSTLAEKREALLFLLALWQIGFTAVVFIISIFFGHKIAGPIYKLTKFMQSFRNGEHPGRLFFRNGDHFSELADEFNLTMESVVENHKKDVVYLSEVNTYLNNLMLIVPEDKKVVIQEIQKNISEIQNRYIES